MSGAWSILDSKRINHDLTKPGSLEHPASQSQIAFNLTVQGLQTFTVQASKSIPELHAHCLGSMPYNLGPRCGRLDILAWRLR